MFIEFLDEKRRNELLELFIERHVKHREASDFLDAHTDADNKISKENARIVDEMIDEVEELKKQIDKKLSEPTTQPILERPGDIFDAHRGTTHGRKTAATTMMVPNDGYRGEFVNALRTHFRQVTNYLQESVDTSGGYLVPEEWDEKIIVALEDENVIRKLARVITTSGAHHVNIQASAPRATWIGEGEEISLASSSFKQVTLDAHKIGVAINVTNELLADAAYDVESYLMAEFVKAVGGAEEDAFLNGDGTGKPAGILPALAKISGGTISTVGSFIGADDLIDLMHNVNRSYRKNAVFIMSDHTLAAIRKLKDANQAFLWQPSYQTGEPERLLGYPVYCSPHMPSADSGNVAVLFGDFGSGVTIAQRGGTTARALHELNALRDMSTFLMIERVDCALVDAAAIRGLKVK